MIKYSRGPVTVAAPAGLAGAEAAVGSSTEVALWTLKYFVDYHLLISSWCCRQAASGTTSDVGQCAHVR